MEITLMVAAGTFKKRNKQILFEVIEHLSNINQTLIEC